MSQQRIQDFGSPLVAESMKLLAASFSDPGILDGNDFVVDAVDRLRINPGSSITDQGVIIIEDEIKTLEIENTSLATDYTVYYSHVDEDISGGVPAILTLLQGLFTDDQIDGVVLGYVRYPGGGIPLDSSHFDQPAPLKLGLVKPLRETADWKVPAVDNGYQITSTTGGAITVTNEFDISGSQPQMLTRFRNNSGSSGSVVLTFPFKVKSQRLATLEMIISTDINTLLTASFIDSNGTVTVLSPTFTGDPNLGLKSVEIGRGTIQDSNTLVYVQLDLQIANAREIVLQAIGLNEFNLPI